MRLCTLKISVVPPASLTEHDSSYLPFFASMVGKETAAGPGVGGAGILLLRLVNVEGKGRGCWKADLKFLCVTCKQEVLTLGPLLRPLPLLPVSLSITLGRSGGFSLVCICSE